MKQLYLLRHAKSSWAEPGTEDFERPLSARGKRACAVVRETLRRNRIEPDLVLCSAARRTRETLQRVAPAFTRDHIVAIERDLYLASARSLLSRLRRLDDAVESALVIGHNPGLERLAILLAGNGDRDARARLAEKFPTGAFAHFRFDGASWRALAAGGGKLVRFVSPRDGDRETD